MVLEEEKEDTEEKDGTMVRKIKEGKWLHSDTRKNKEADG